MSELQERFSHALDEFLATDDKLLIMDVNERTISSDFHSILKRYFPEWDVDCEYNRIGTEKRKKLIDISKEMFRSAKEAGRVPAQISSLEELEASKSGVSVFPDIIIHHRGEVSDNLLVIEIKKANNPDANLGWDEYKIEFFVRMLNYSAGVFVVMNTDIKVETRADFISSIRWFL